MEVVTRPDTITNIASYYQINAETLRRHYKHKVSGYKQWEQHSHAEEYLIYPENITTTISIDEVSLSKGELYTIVTNKNIKSKNKGSLIAIINGTEAETIQSALERIPLEIRSKVQEITLDMAPNMALAARNSFQNSVPVVDRFHVVKLVLEGMQHLRTKLRWEALELENKELKKAKLEKRKYQAEILSNGDTTKELLVRSKYLLYKFEEHWTANQKKRAAVLFEKYPILKAAYKLVCSFRSIYKSIYKEDAKRKFYDWKQKVTAAKIEEFNTVVNSIEHHLPGILNYFNNRNTNANAESFNSKIKGFRANLRGVSDVKFFLFRLQNLFA
jgi:transposase